ncbi:hypothetical protein DYB37_006827 [Aphanomyces astaci]|uniref:Tyrosinase copper-binding domain-containing protein n=1 Tax=Aphanomyces astaci TaxID=112090 RepID=A0A3R7EE27_APHAT|nr:hypothetical protein DYB35_007289 [Aphanomyces astaci]RHZ19689.1 hypothetical protein DYB37_006827 [Aphanomyces astaci]
MLELIESSDASAEADSPPSRCCFNDGDVISLRADTDWFMGRCNGCVPRGAYPDSAFVHVSDPKDAPWAQWQVFNTCDGKLVLQADTGKYLGRCNNCAPGAAYPDQAFVHVEDWHTSPWAKWVCVDAGNGKIALQADSGRYLARCNSCLPGAYPNAAFVHATSVSEAYAQWTVVSKNPSAGLSMVLGFHHKFIEVHLESKSEHEAHDCLFFLWHRRYLLAYETMLRSLGDQYRCITLPFWDFSTLSAKYATGSCSTFPECNPLLSDMGALETVGYDLGAGTYTVSGAGCQADTCVKSAHPVTRNFCQSQDAFSTKRCYQYVAACIPRNKWSLTAPPSDTYISNVYNQLFSSKPYDFTKVTKGVQYRYHNGIHGALASTMGTFASPGDPIFYVHHATVDALYAIYYQCVVPPLNVDLKHSTVWPNRADWGASCSKVRNGVTGAYEPTDHLTMNLIGANGKYVDVQDPSSVLKPFFDAVGLQTFADLYDIRALGEMSYSYDFGLSSLGGLAQQCDKYASPTTVRVGLEEATTDEVVSKEDQFMREMYLYCQAQNVPQDQIMERINWMQCVFHNECKQGVFDYSDAFRTSFDVHGSPYCYVTISQLANRTLSIDVPGWEQVYARHYSCASTVM